MCGTVTRVTLHIYTWWFKGYGSRIPYNILYLRPTRSIFWMRAKKKRK
jgi:hypothetical protein